MRGEPLVALCVVLGAWIGMRMMFWDDGWLAPAASAESARPAFETPESLNEEETMPDDEAGLPEGVILPAEQVPLIAQPVRPMRRSHRAELGLPRVAGYVTPARRLRQVALNSARHGLQQRVLSQLPPEIAGYRLTSASAGTGHSKPLPSSQGRAAKPTSTQLQGRRRWSGDGWLLLRPGAAGLLAAGTAPSTYGASQMGAVLRYHFAPDSRYRPFAYLRTTAALDGVERDLALGASARILSRLPVLAQAELRATQQVGKTRLRPAVLAVTELAPLALPQGLRAEAYAQAGYVGGRYATPFADGQLRVDRRAVTLGRAELRTGAGIWGGAQKGAARMDLGPTAAVGIALGRSASARVAFDWRFRVAGKAAPASGPAITLSAGF